MVVMKTCLQIPIPSRNYLLIPKMSTHSGKYDHEVWSGVKTSGGFQRRYIMWLNVTTLRSETPRSVPPKDAGFKAQVSLKPSRTFQKDFHRDNLVVSQVRSLSL